MEKIKKPYKNIFNYLKDFWIHKDRSEKITFFSLIFFVFPNILIIEPIINNGFGFWFTFWVYILLRCIEGVILFVILSLYGKKDLPGNISLSIPYLGGVYWMYRFFIKSFQAKNPD